MIITCIDDMCIGAGECMHGDGEDICPVCEGEPYEGEEEWEPLRAASPTAKESEPTHTPLEKMKVAKGWIDTEYMMDDRNFPPTPRSTGETESPTG